MCDCCSLRPTHVFVSVLDLGFQILFKCELTVWKSKFVLPKNCVLLICLHQVEFLRFMWAYVQWADLCFLPLQTLQTMKNALISPQTLSRKVSEFLVFWFVLCCVLGLRGVFVTAVLEVGYGDWRKHTTGRLSDTFQTTGRQSDFRPNHRWVMCNYPQIIIYSQLII